MSAEIEKLLTADSRAFYEAEDGIRRKRGVGYEGDSVREKEAIRQANMHPTPITEVISLCNSFAELLKKSPEKGRVASVEPFFLSAKTSGLVVDNILLVSGGEWKSEFSEEKHVYKKLTGNIRKYKKGLT